MRYFTDSDVSKIGCSVQCSLMLLNRVEQRDVMKCEIEECTKPITFIL